jgi:hypothetical protein
MGANEGIDSPETVNGKVAATVWINPRPNSKTQNKALTPYFLFTTARLI